MTSFALLMKELATFLTCYVNAFNVRGSESEPLVLCHKCSTAVQTTTL